MKGQNPQVRVKDRQLETQRSILSFQARKNWQIPNVLSFRINITSPSITQYTYTHVCVHTHCSICLTLIISYVTPNSDFFRSHKRALSSSSNMSRTVFVGNIPYDLPEPTLIAIFEEVGPVKNFRLKLDEVTNKSKGFGFCEYHDADTAASAIRNLDGYDVGGRTLRVNPGNADPASEVSLYSDLLSSYEC